MPRRQSLECRRGGRRGSHPWGTGLETGQRSRTLGLGSRQQVRVVFRVDFAFESFPTCPSVANIGLLAKLLTGSLSLVEL